MKWCPHRTLPSLKLRQVAAGSTITSWQKLLFVCSPGSPGQNRINTNVIITKQQQHSSYHVLWSISLGSRHFSKCLTYFQVPFNNQIHETKHQEFWNHCLWGTLFPSALIPVSYHIMVRIWQRPGFKSQLCHSPTEWPRASSYSPLQSCFLISKMVKMTVPHSQGYCEGKVRSVTSQFSGQQVGEARGWQPHAMIPAAVKWSLNGHHIKAVSPRADKQDFLYMSSSLFLIKNLSYEPFL